MANSEKTEKPSLRKLSQAKKKGQIFKSKDIIDNATLIAAFIILKLSAPYFLNEFNKLLRTLLTPENLTVNNKNLLFSFYQGNFFLIKVVAPVLLVLLIITLVANYSQVGFIFSKESLKFDIKKIDPISGFKRIFSKKSLVELLKFLLKLIIISFMISSSLKKDFVSINAVVFHGIRYSTAETFNWMFSLIFKVILTLFAFSFLDYFLQKRIYMSDMKMTKQEVKDEYKEMEGDPLLKGKIKEKQREIATSSLIEAASNATVLIANPTHIAICLKYEFGMFAPVVTAIARDHLALKLKEIAKENDVAIVENRPLARALFNDAEINQPIPTEYFKAVAQIISTIMHSRV